MCAGVYVTRVAHVWVYMEHVWGMYVTRVYMYRVCSTVLLFIYLFLKESVSFIYLSS